MREREREREREGGKELDFMCVQELILSSLRQPSIGCYESIFLYTLALT